MRGPREIVAIARGMCALSTHARTALPPPRTSLPQLASWKPSDSLFAANFWLGEYDLASGPTVSMSTDCAANSTEMCETLGGCAEDATCFQDAADFVWVLKGAAVVTVAMTSDVSNDGCGDYVLGYDATTQGAGVMKPGLLGKFCATEESAKLGNGESLTVESDGKFHFFGGNDEGGTMVIRVHTDLPTSGGTGVGQVVAIAQSEAQFRATSSCGMGLPDNTECM